MILLVELAIRESDELFNDTLELLVSGTLCLQDQSKMIPARGTSLNYRSGVKLLKILDLEWDANTLDRYIRALSMPGFEPPYAVLKSGEKIYFQRTGFND